MATVYGANFSELGRNMIADGQMRAQRTSDILRNLNATAEGLMASRDRRYGTDADRERAAANLALGLTQEENNLEIERERNRLFGKQIDEQAEAEKRALAKEGANRRAAFEVANSKAAEYQTIYADASREAAENTAAANRAAALIATLKAQAKTPETTAAIAEAEAALSEANAMRTAATRRAATAKQAAVSIGAESGFLFDETGPRWKFIDRRGEFTDALPPASGASSIGGEASAPRAGSWAQSAAEATAAGRAFSPRDRIGSGIPLPAPEAVTVWDANTPAINVPQRYSPRYDAGPQDVAPQMSLPQMSPRAVPQRRPIIVPDQPQPLLFEGDTGSGPIGPMRSFLDNSQRYRGVPAELLQFGDGADIPRSGLPSSYGARYRIPGEAGPIPMPAYTYGTNPPQNEVAPAWPIGPLFNMSGQPRYRTSDGMPITMPPLPQQQLPDWIQNPVWDQPMIPTPGLDTIQQPMWGY